MLSRRVLSSNKLSLRRCLATEAAHTVASISALPRGKKGPKTQIKTAIILNRSPIITRTIPAFETAFHSYQARIRRALHNPFPEEFYFKQGSFVEPKFAEEERLRERRSFGPRFGVEVQKKETVALSAMDIIQQEQLKDQEAGNEEIAKRIHPSDFANDFHSLDRKGKRNVYLVLKAKEDDKQVWRFPQGDLDREKDTGLHLTAQRQLAAECGVDMDTWIVSRNPIGVWKHSRPEAEAYDPTPGTAVFFYKAHIMSGQVKPESSENISDFAWLTKQEIQKQVAEEYWEAVHEMLTDQ